MSDEFKEIKQELKEIRQEQARTNEILARNTASLEIHIEGVNTLRELHQQNVDRIKPIEQHIEFQRSLAKLFVKGITWVLGILASTAAIYHYFFSNR